MSRAPLDIPVLLAETGTPVTLRDVVGGQPTLVVLMRHLDCPFCEAYLGRVIKEHQRIGRIVLVGHGSPEELMEQHAGLPPEFVVLADRDQALYDGFRTRRLRSLRHVRISLRSIPTMLRHAFTGGKVGREGQDLLQLGGDAIIDADGTTTWLRLSSRPDDRPTALELASHMHRAA